MPAESANAFAATLPQFRDTEGHNFAFGSTVDLFGSMLSVLINKNQFIDTCRPARKFRSYCKPIDLPAGRRVWKLVL